MTFLDEVHFFPELILVIISQKSFAEHVTVLGMASVHFGITTVIGKAPTAI